MKITYNSGPWEPVDADVPRDITGPEFVDVPLPPTSGLWWVWFVGFTILVLLAVLWLSRRPKAQRTRASVRALGQLDRLLALQLVAKNQAERHFTLLAGIVRRFIDKAYGVPASRLTTAELLDVAAKNPLLEEHAGFLRDFFAACDLAKFAPPTALPELKAGLENDLRVWLWAQNPESKSPPSLDAPLVASKMSDS